MSTAPPVVFLGPTLPVDEATGILEAEYLPPVELGDVWRVSQERPPAVGIVDGYFSTVPAVWHKEILFALSEGIPVYGAASMGALRAAELERFGMVPIGTIAEAYASGRLTGDDEVALLHADPEHGYPEHGYRSFSEALVNMRATVSASLAAGVVTPATGEAVVSVARSLFYPDRTWDRVLAATPAPGPELAALRDWLPSGRVDQKRADAIALLTRMRDDAAKGRTGAAIPAHRPFIPTVPWLELVRRETPTTAILEEFLFSDPLPAGIAESLDRARAGDAVDWLPVLTAEPDWPDRCRRARRKARRWRERRFDAQPPETGAEADRLLAWFFGERLSWPDDLERFLRARGWTRPATVLDVARREAAFLGSRP